MSKYDAIGLMSGTSLDGLDIAFVEFFSGKGKWDFELKHAETIGYSDDWKRKLSSAHKLKPYELKALSIAYGRLLGKLTKQFIDSHRIFPSLIASHGHTVYHNPSHGITVQIGEGEEIAALTGVTTVYDFRAEDVALGGQGAPLVPIGDELLFGDFDACVNLGGFANVSMQKNGKRIAYDICPVNFVLNKIAGYFGKPYDSNGDIARNGRVDLSLLSKLNAVDFYKRQPPKSLGREWVEMNIEPLTDASGIAQTDLAATFTEHIAVQIAKSLKNIKGKVLFTGGGTFNGFLMQKIREKINPAVIIPPKDIIDFKEALIFAFMGVLRMRNMVNVFGSVTGSGRNISAGKIVVA